MGSLHSVGVPRVKQQHVLPPDPEIPEFERPRGVSTRDGGAPPTIAAANNRTRGCKSPPREATMFHISRATALAARPHDDARTKPWQEVLPSRSQTPRCLKRPLFEKCVCKCLVVACTTPKGGARRIVTRSSRGFQRTPRFICMIGIRWLATGTSIGYSIYIITGMFMIHRSTEKSFGMRWLATGNSC